MVIYMCANKIAVITSIYGSYNTLQSIDHVIDSGLVDWYCFTDNPATIANLPLNGWKIITTPYHKLNTADTPYSTCKNSFINITDDMTYNMMSAKYYKLQTHNIDILSSYEYYIWIDGRIVLHPQFLKNILTLLTKNSQCSIFNFRHPFRNKVNDEVNACFDWKKYIKQDLKYQINEYFKDQFDDNIGLYALGAFFRKNVKDINLLFDDWWYHNLKYSYQDQISYPYICWKHNRKPDYILNQNIFNNDLFRVLPNHLKDYK